MNESPHSLVSLPAGLLTTKEASIVFRISVPKLRQWVDSGKLRDYSATRWRMLVSSADIMELIGKGQGKRKVRGIALMKQEQKAAEANAAKAKA